MDSLGSSAAHPGGIAEPNQYEACRGPSEGLFSALPIDIISNRILEKLVAEDLLVLAAAARTFEKASCSEPLWRSLFRACVDPSSFALYMRIDPPPDGTKETHRYWRDLMRAVSRGALRLESAVSELQQVDQRAGFQLSMKHQLLTVSCHAAVVVGECNILIGGWRPYGHPDSGVVVLNCNTLEAYEAQLSPNSISPVPRQCHAACSIAPAIGADLARVLLLGGTEMETNSKIYNSTSAMVLELLDPEARTVRWRVQQLQGEGPGQYVGIFHHVMHDFDGGKKVIVWGGDSVSVAENDEESFRAAQRECSHRASSAFVLDVHTWTWTRVATGGELPGHRGLARSVMYHNKMVVVGGTLDPISPWTLQCGTPARMTPYVLDLCTWNWQRGPDGMQPEPRVRFVAECSGDFLFGGGGHSSLGKVFDDSFRLDLRTLHWSKWATGTAGDSIFHEASAGTLSSGIIVGGYTCCHGQAQGKARVFVYCRTGRYAGGSARLKGLRSSKHLNGAVGKLMAYVWNKGRWALRLPGDVPGSPGDAVQVLAENIERMLDPGDGPWCTPD